MISTANLCRLCKVTPKTYNLLGILTFRNHKIWRSTESASKTWRNFSVRTLRTSFLLFQKSWRRTLCKRASSWACYYRKTVSWDSLNSSTNIFRSMRWNKVWGSESRASTRSIDRGGIKGFQAPKTRWRNLSEIILSSALIETRYNTLGLLQMEILCNQPFKES